MEKITLVKELSNEAVQQEGRTESASGKGALDVRTLSELELVLASGGDGIVSWG